MPASTKSNGGMEKVQPGMIIDIERGLLRDVYARYFSKGRICAVFFEKGLGSYRYTI
jgi:hypothetical protein